MSETYIDGVSKYDLARLATAQGLRTRWGSWFLGRDGDVLSQSGSGNYLGLDLTRCIDVQYALGLICNEASHPADGESVRDLTRALDELFDLSGLLKRDETDIDAKAILKQRRARADRALGRTPLAPRR